MGDVVAVDVDVVADAVADAVAAVVVVSLPLYRVRVLLQDPSMICLFPCP